MGNGNHENHHLQCQQEMQHVTILYPYQLEQPASDRGQGLDSRSSVHLPMTTLSASAETCYQWWRWTTSCQNLSLSARDMKAPILDMIEKMVAKSWLNLATWLTVACQIPLSMGFSRQEYWSGLPFPSPGDLPDPGIEPGSPALQADSLPTELQGKPLNANSYHLSHKGSSRILNWVAYPFSRGSTQPRNQTGVSCIADRFFTSWATRGSPPRDDTDI